MPILVTGANGFVGRAMCAELAHAGHRVLAHDLHAAEGVYGCDLRDRRAVAAMVQALQPEGCVHLAGMAFVPHCVADPSEAFSINVLGTIHLLEALRQAVPDARVLVVSSASVYGKSIGAQLLSEEAPLAPCDPYAASKAAADLSALALARHFGSTLMTARPVNHVGPGQAHGYVLAAFVRQLRTLAASQAKPIMRVGNLESQRDFLDVRDVVRAYRLLLEKGRGGAAYNIASGRLRRMGEYLEQLSRIAGLAPEIQVDPQLYRPTDASPLLDTTRLREETGWAPEISMDAMLRNLWAGGR